MLEDTNLLDGAQMVLFYSSCTHYVPQQTILCIIILQKLLLN